MDTQVADLLGGERVLGASVKSNLDLARATRRGLPAETAVQLVEAFGLPAMGPLGALIGSLRHPANRKKTGDASVNASPARLTPEQSDIVIRTASTLAKAIDTLGDRENGALADGAKPRIGGAPHVRLADGWLADFEAPLCESPGRRIRW